MESRLRLFLVRHGQVASNRDLRYVGLRDEELTAIGSEQARRLGQALAEVPLRRVLSSPLKRALSTAAPIAEACGLEVEQEARLAEQSYGAWEGRSRGELRAEPASREKLREFDTDVGSAPPGGESLLEVQQRVVSLVEDLVREESASGEPEPPCVALVTHVGPIKALLSSALDITLHQSRRFFLDPGTITVVDWGEPCLLRLFNAHGHIDLSQARWMLRRSPPGPSGAGPDQPRSDNR